MHLLVTIGSADGRYNPLEQSDFTMTLLAPQRMRRVMTASEDWMIRK